MGCAKRNKKDIPTHTTSTNPLVQLHRSASPSTKFINNQSIENPDQITGMYRLVRALNGRARPKLCPLLVRPNSVYDWRNHALLKV